MNANTRGFRMLPSYYEVIRDLPDKERLLIYDAIMDYGFGNEVGDLPPILRGYFLLITPSLDQSIRFEIKQKDNGDKGGRPKKNPNKTQMEPKQNPEETQAKASRNLDVDVDVDFDNDFDVDGAVDNAIEKKIHSQKKKYGIYGWVKLTDAQYTKLVADLGQSELDRCIQYVDEYAQLTGNKKGYKDWNLVIRRCSRGGWGREHTAATDMEWRKNAVVAWGGQPSD